MKQETHRALSAIKIVQNENGESPTVFTRENSIFVSAEDGKGFADYYGEFRGGYPWIHPNLERAAKNLKGYWEWQNPGCICLVL